MSDATPQPTVWPECSLCGAPWVLRRCHLLVHNGPGSMRFEDTWAFQRDCKHGRQKPEPILVNAAGPLPDQPAEATA